MSGTPKESVAREQRLPVVFILLALTGALAVSAGLIWVTLDYKQRRQAILSGVCIGVGAAVFTLGIILIGNLPAPPQSPDSLQVPIKALALPLDKVPLTGYHITQDEPISASQVRWEREFSNRSTIGGGATPGWIFASTSWRTPRCTVEAGSCDFTPQPGARMPLTSAATTATIVGAGTKACKHTFEGGARTFAFRTATQQIGIFLQAGPRSDISDDAAMGLLASLATQEVDIVKAKLPAEPPPPPPDLREAVTTALTVLAVLLLGTTSIPSACIKTRHQSLRTRYERTANSPRVPTQPTTTPVALCQPVHYPVHRHKFHPLTHLVQTTNPLSKR